MFEHVVRVKVAPLRHAFARRQLGQNAVQHLRIAQNAQSAVGRGRVARLFVGVKQRIQFGVNAFGHDVA